MPTEPSSKHEPGEEKARPAAASPLGTTTLVVSAILLAMPALVPVLVLIEPSLVPFVPAMGGADGPPAAFLIAMSAVLLLMNWGFLWAVNRWLATYAESE